MAERIDRIRNGTSIEGRLSIDQKLAYFFRGVILVEVFRPCLNFHGSKELLVINENAVEVPSAWMRSYPSIFMLIIW